MLCSVGRKVRHVGWKFAQSFMKALIHATIKKQYRSKSGAKSMKNRNLLMPESDQKAAYETMINMKEKFGVFYRTCFHIHTPASYDYKLLKEWDEQKYKDASETDVFELCVKRRVIPDSLTVDDFDINDDRFSYYTNKKELFSFLLLADAIFQNGIEIALVADHNTLDGINKLEKAINEILKFKAYDTYPAIISGIEISCADKLHVVAIIDGKEMITQISDWLKEALVSVQAGIYRTSYELLKYIREIGGISYIAHIDTYDLFKEEYLSGGYKKKLLSDEILRFVGLSDIKQKEKINEYLKRYRSVETQYVLDNDAHNIDALIDNHFLIKGSKRNFSMVKEALNDYDISVSLKEENSARQYIAGIYVEKTDEGFLSSKEPDGFSLRFSNALNCIIGGRGTGKSSVLQLLEYVLCQRCANEKQLDFICAHGNTWVLYKYKDDDYLIEMRLPFKEDKDDNILRYFGQNLANQYGYRYQYDHNKIEEQSLRNLNVFRVVKSDTEWMLEHVNDKKKILNQFFDIKYSVNELVNTASGKEINQFIYRTLFANKVLDNPERIIKARKKPGLKKLVDEVQNFLIKRKEEVNEVISKFNETQKNILRIVYSQENREFDPGIEYWLFDDSSYEHRWYKNYNITRKNIVEYLLAVYDRVGMFEFIRIILSNKAEEANAAIRLLDFCTPLDKNIIEEELNEVNDNNASLLIEEVFSQLANDKNIDKIIKLLKRYVANMESFTLEFNINNKEGTKQTPMYKPVDTLSLGQKVVAMLSFVLGYSEYSEDYRPLIIDQPEDNLDNQYIYKNLVKQLRDIKEKRQVIIATHNATLVTNAKADQVCVMDSDNNHGWVEVCGYPSEKRIKKKIINYLEGGRESFLHKMDIYKEALE